MHESFPSRRGPTRRGFTLIELLIVLGVILILVGLALPTLSGSLGQARLTRAMVTAREIALMVDQYTKASRDVYPIVKGSALATKWEWPDAMIAAGVAESYQGIDPDHNRPPEDRMAASGVINWLFSMALCYDANLLTAGQQVVLPGPAPVGRNDDFPASPVRTDQVLFPSDKGMLAPAWVMWGNQAGPWGFLDAFKKPAPVPFCDLHVESLRWDQCIKGGVLDKPSGTYAGIPVLGTWGGFRGRDRDY